MTSSIGEDVSHGRRIVTMGGLTPEEASLLKNFEDGDDDIDNTIVKVIMPR